MKYIRTENGIYEVVDFDNECIIPSPIVKMNGRLTHCSNYKDYKQADTIEELCDWFFLEGAKGYPVTYKKFYTAKRSKERMQIEQNLYGVIFIRGKGLIYVAKLNDKGDLELI